MGVPAPPLGDGSHPPQASETQKGRIASLCRTLWAGFAGMGRVEHRAYLGEATRRAIRSPGDVKLARDLK